MPRLSYTRRASYSGTSSTHFFPLNKGTTLSLFTLLILFTFYFQPVIAAMSHDLTILPDLQPTRVLRKNNNKKCDATKGRIPADMLNQDFAGRSEYVVSSIYDDDFNAKKRALTVITVDENSDLNIDKSDIDVEYETVTTHGATKFNKTNNNNSLGKKIRQNMNKIEYKFPGATSSSTIRNTTDGDIKGKGKKLNKGEKKSKTSKDSKGKSKGTKKTNTVSELPTSPVKFDLTVRPLFTHKDNELHCPDRTLLHPCTTELKLYLESEQNSNSTLELKKTAYDCAEHVYHNSHQFSFDTIKNMTHLLLDLDTTVHFFDKQPITVLADKSPGKMNFFQLGLKFGRDKLIFHEECLKELDTKSHLQCRCPNLYGKILLVKLKNVGLIDEARSLFNYLLEYEHNPLGSGSQNANGISKKGSSSFKPFQWKHFTQTPQIYIPNLEDLHYWPKNRKEELPIWDVLEKNYEVIKREVVGVFEGAGNKDKDSDLLSDAYRFLFKDGKWDQIVLFSGRKWEPNACSPNKPLHTTCKVLRQSLESRKQHYYPWTSNQNEQVVALRLKPNTTVEEHCGPSNNILNIHLGLKGLTGAKLYVKGQLFHWEEGKVIAWDGSFDHSVNCLECVEDRIIIMVRYMHPGIERSHYGEVKKTAFEDVREEMFRELELEN